MKTFLKGFFTGSYITGALFTFFVVGFFCILGGKDTTDLLRPFVYALFWPVCLPLFLTGKVWKMNDLTKEL